MPGLEVDGYSKFNTRVTKPYTKLIKETENPKIVTKRVGLFETDINALIAISKFFAKFTFDFPFFLFCQLKSTKAASYPVCLIIVLKNGSLSFVAISIFATFLETKQNSPAPFGRFKLLNLFINE